jgi:glyoxylase-like metal-dependent hydrolase (beta-lactamase superfamily II)
VEKMIKIDLFQAGYCMQCEKIARRNGKIKNVKFPMIVGYIEYGKEKIIFDTGYSEHFKECTQKMPEKLYDLVVPVMLSEEKNIYNILKKNGINPEEITKVILSHFHADHISGVSLFNNTKVLCSKIGFKDFSESKGLMAIKEGYLHKLLPKDFGDHAIFFEDLNKVDGVILEGFDNAYWIDQEKEIAIVELLGHKKGHYGLYIKELNVFFIADACWKRESFLNLDYPNIIGLSIQENKKEYIETINKLNKLSKSSDIKIIPSHCIDTYNDFKKSV